MTHVAPEIHGVRDSQTVTLLDGHRVGLAVFGAENGFPIVAFHGTPASRFMFKVAEDAATRLGVTLYCPERPGYGLSGPAVDVSAPDALERRTDEFVELVDALGLERFSILGISGGAPYAVALACRLGTRVRGLGLVGPMGPIADVPDDVRKRVSMRHRFLFEKFSRWPGVLRVVGGIGVALFSLAPTLFAKTFAFSLGPADRKVLSRAFAQSSLIEMTREAVRNGVGGAGADLQVFSRPWCVDFSALRAPAKLWVGTADRLVPTGLAHWLGRQLPGCRVVTLEGAGHFWVYEEVDEVIASMVRLADR